MKKRLLILIMCSVIVFFNSLFNGFVGDDVFLIETNEFFETWSHERHLFSPVYSTDPDAVFNQDNFSSGSVAYRPVLSLTYFLDHSLSGKAPFGYHLQNMIWHVLNVCLVFLVLFYSGIGSIRRISFWAAMLFALHPLRAEAVCAIGYRADLLSAAFVLAAFLFYIRAKRVSERMPALLFGGISVVLFGLGLFSKESAIVFPALIIFYECVCAKNPRRLKPVLSSGVMAGYAGMAVFYVLVYVFLFPNRALAEAVLMGRGAGDHVYYIGAILGYYLKGSFFPWTVRTLPPVFSTDFTSVVGPEELVWTVLAFLPAVWIWKRRPKDVNGLLFGSAWFFLPYLPVSNLVPMVTPVAHRYIYLPSVGLSVLTAFILLEINVLLLKRGMVRGKFIPVVFCVFCAAWTVSLNTAWKNSFVIARHMIRDFPENPRGYLFTGLYLADQADRESAFKYLKRAADLGLEDPRLFLKIGESCEFLGRREEAREWFYKGIQYYPGLYQSYAALGRSFLSSGEPGKAAGFLEQALFLRASYASAGYLIQAYRMTGQDEFARDVYEKTSSLMRKESERMSLQVLMDTDVEEFPVYLGL